MFIYSPDKMIPERIEKAKEILEKIPVKHAFITGSFLYKEDYNDIDLFVLTRSKKKIVIEGVDIHTIDFNQLGSLFYHSITKLCVSKSVLPKRKLRINISDYWEIINETLTPMKGEYDMNKEVRMAVLYTLYFESENVPDSFDMSTFRFKSRHEIEEFILERSPKLFFSHMKKSYLRRFFYGLTEYYSDAQPSIPLLVGKILEQRASS